MARVALSRMMQDRGEPIRAFAARLCGQVEVCRFTKKCTGCDQICNQGEERVADQLCIGQRDPRGPTQTPRPGHGGGGYHQIRGS